MSSKIIYPSSKVTPYVYLVTHKITGSFYFGSRYSKKVTQPSHLDFPLYKTSAPYVRRDFDSYDWVILAEFFTETAIDDAYDVEQQLIFEHWGNPMLLNRKCYINNFPRFNTTGPLSESHKKNISNGSRGKKRIPMSDSTKAKISASSAGRIISAATKNKMSLAKMNKPASPKLLAHLKRLHESNIGKPMPEHTRLKMMGRIMPKEVRDKISATKLSLVRRVGHDPTP
jgi:hypothetical protein